MQQHTGIQKTTALRAMTIFCALALCAGACATTQARKTETTTFLGDYSMLKKGGEGEALLLYIDPQANIKSYNAILMDSVQIYASTDDSLGDMSKDDRQNLVNYLSAAVHERLKGDYAFVNQPGAGVMRLRIAITEAEDANVTMDTVSTIMPIGLALSGLQRIATGTPSFVGTAGIEAEMQDSQSGRRLWAAVDRRAGSKVTGKGDKFDEWRAVKDSFDYWAERLKKRLAQERAK